MPSTLLYGPMKSGKSRELIRIYQTHMSEHEGTYFIYSFGPDVIHTRAEEEDLEATPLSDMSSLVRMFTDIVHELQTGALVICFFDEVQFADPLFAHLVQNLSRFGAYVYMAGLDTDYKREAFETTSLLMQLSDRSHRFESECDVCQSPSQYTQRLLDGNPVQDGERVVLDNVHGGDTEYTYETRCERCYVS